jgi:hypothetical protein
MGVEDGAELEVGGAAAQEIEEFSLRLAVELRVPETPT